jgi:hypothetical protein
MTVQQLDFPLIRTILLFIAVLHDGILPNRLSVFEGGSIQKRKSRVKKVFDSAGPFLRVQDAPFGCPQRAFAPPITRPNPRMYSQLSF